MIKKIREKLLAFINADEDVPILAGFSVGLYLILFIYSRNFGIVNSWQQLLFFIGYYIALPVFSLYTGYILAGLTKLSRYKKNFLFTGMIAFFAFYFLEINHVGFSKKIAFIVIAILAAILSFWIKKYYKLLIILLFLMVAFNVKPLINVAITAATASDEWKEQPDDIENIIFKHKPNIYYIQPDGYTNFNNLKDSIHKFDNSEFETFLKDNSFTFYNDYRSNYISTLLSNSATLSMKHHYIAKQIDFYEARKIIMSDNAVLRILNNNGYETSFITETPYLMMNRPPISYDYTNIQQSKIPFIGDGSKLQKDVFHDFKERMNNTRSESPQFYFIEKFLPSHIPNNESGSEGGVLELKKYLGRVKEVNLWLKEVITYITIHDPEGIVIVGADHGGYTGFDYSAQNQYKTDNINLINSMFGAQLSVKWNNSQYQEYDDGLKSGVNLFRTVFSFLAEDKSYLNHLQENGSYIHLKEPKGNYRYINDNGATVFQEL